MLLFSDQVKSYSFRPHGLQHCRLPRPSPSPEVGPSSRPLNWWRQPAISSSVALFSCFLSLPASGFFFQRVSNLPPFHILLQLCFFWLLFTENSSKTFVNTYSLHFISPHFLLDPCSPHHSTRIPLVKVTDSIAIVKPNGCFSVLILVALWAALNMVVPRASRVDLTRFSTYCNGCPSSVSFASSF